MITKLLQKRTVYSALFIPKRKKKYNGLRSMGELWFVFLQIHTKNFRSRMNVCVDILAWSRKIFFCQERKRLYGQIDVSHRTISGNGRKLVSRFLFFSSFYIFMRTRWCQNNFYSRRKLSPSTKLFARCSLKQKPIYSCFKGLLLQNQFLYKWAILIHLHFCNAELHL